jgi:hypothetical protein
VFVAAGAVEEKKRRCGGEGGRFEGVFERKECGRHLRVSAGRGKLASGRSGESDRGREVEGRTKIKVDSSLRSE